MYKHIVLLTDGISEEGDSMTLTREASTNHVTISTVGLGQDVNRAFLEKVATIAEGKSYFLNDPSGLEQILLRDVEEHTGVTAVEKAITAEGRQAGGDSGGRGDGKRARTARLRALPAAAHVGHHPDGRPRRSAAVRWQYGLGRAAVFTSDAKNRWAANWVTVAGLRPLLGEHLPRPAAARHAQRDYRRFRPRQSNELVVDYRLSRNVEEPADGARHFRAGPERLPRAAEGGQGRRGTLSRAARDRAEPGTVPHPSAGRFARLPGGRLLPPGRRDAGVRQQRPVAAPDRGVHRRALQSVRPGSRSTRPAGASARRWNCGRACWRWRCCSISLELIMRKWKGVAEALHLRPREPAEAPAS